MISSRSKNRRSGDDASSSSAAAAIRDNTNDDMSDHYHDGMRSIQQQQQQQQGKSRGSSRSSSRQQSGDRRRQVVSNEDHKARQLNEQLNEALGLSMGGSSSSSTAAVVRGSGKMHSSFASSSRVRSGSRHLDDASFYSTTKPPTKKIFVQEDQEEEKVPPRRGKSATYNKNSYKNSYEHSDMRNVNNDSSISTTSNTLDARMRYRQRVMGRRAESAHFARSDSTSKKKTKKKRKEINRPTSLRIGDVFVVLHSSSALPLDRGHLFPHIWQNSSSNDFMPLVTNQVVGVSEQ